MPAILDHLRFMPDFAYAFKARATDASA